MEPNVWRLGCWSVSPRRIGDSDRDAVAERMAALQQQVARLKDELAAKQVTTSRAPPPPPMQAAPVAQSAPAAQSAPVVRSGPSAPFETATGTPSLDGSSLPTLPLVQSPSSAPVGSTASSPVQPSAHVEARKTNQPALSVTGLATEPAPPVVTVPQRKDFAVAEPTSGRADVTKSEYPRTELGKAEGVKSDPSKVMAQRFAVAKPAPLPQSPPRQDVDDTQSVLARLRQIGPAPVQQSDSPTATEPRQPEPRFSQGSSPSLPKLNAARVALASGRIDEARRLLQEAQLQLVFRPINISGDEQPLAGKGAADVAHALEALSANNISLSRRYIDIAADDLSGGGMNAPAQVSDLRATGYAPAYPPR